MHLLSQPFPCIRLSFAGGEGTLGSRDDGRRADTSVLLPLPWERMSPLLLDK